MPLPDSERVIYSSNPLAEVTAQLRFPPILRIESETPAQFQEAIRERYPLYRRVVPTGHFPANMPPQIRSLIQGVGPVQHLFETQDRKTSVTLSRETLTLKTIAYSRWETFREGLDAVRTVFEPMYRPAHYARLGLRYVDIIRRSLIGLGGTPWADLLNPSIGGELTASEFGESVDSASRQLHCKLPEENCFLTLKTGIAFAEPATTGEPKERCFLIDCDFHSHKRTESTYVMATLDIFNRVSGNLFRWAIRDRLRDALRPQPLA